MWVDWHELVDMKLMEVSIMFDICTYCVFTLYACAHGTVILCTETANMVNIKGVPSNEHPTVLIEEYRAWISESPTTLTYPCSIFMSVFSVNSQLVNFLWFHANIVDWEWGLYKFCQSMKKMIKVYWSVQWFNTGKWEINWLIIN